MEQMKIELLQIDENRRLSMSDIDRKQRELEEMGFYNVPPILINDKHTILDGVKRYLVLHKMGFESVPVQRFKKTTKVVVNYNFMFNRLKLVA